MRAPFPLAVVLALVAASAQADDHTFTGYARTLDTGELLYIESHEVSDGGSADESRVVLYRCTADSVPFARKILRYSADRTMPTFAFEDARSGFAEGLRRDATSLTVFARAGASAPLRSEPITPVGRLVVDAGFDEFVLTHWESLERKSTLEVPFLVPTLLKSVDFRIRKVDEVKIDGESASVIRLSLAGPLGWFLPDIDVSYRQRDRRLMRYRGLTNIRDASGQLLKAQIDFPDDGRGDSAVDLAQLRSLPLAPCGAVR